MLTPILKELEDFMTDHGYPIIKKFNIGKAQEETIELFKNMDLYLPNDVIELYKWKNGISGIYEEGTTISELSLFADGIMFPLEYAVSTYALEAKVEKYIQENFFPIFTGGGGDYILMDLSKKNRSENLFLYSPSILLLDKPMTIYDSLEALFKTVLTTYQTTGYYFDGNSLEVDFEIRDKIAAELNPKSDFWKE